MKDDEKLDIRVAWAERLLKKAGVTDQLDDMVYDVSYEDEPDEEEWALPDDEAADLSEDERDEEEWGRRMSVCEERASQINSDGLHSQIFYLLENRVNVDDILGVRASVLPEEERDDEQTIERIL